MAISLSLRGLPEIREYERTSTTVANAYVLPRDGALSRRSSKPSCARQGIAGPLLLMMSSGGITTRRDGAALPVRLVESGPAGGAILALHGRGARTASTRRVAFDMGGTTAKICLIDDGEPQRSRQFEVARAYRFVQGQRPAGAHPGDRDGRDRRRRRLDRPRRCAGPHPGRPG